METVESVGIPFDSFAGRSSAATITAERLPLVVSRVLGQRLYRGLEVRELVNESEEADPRGPQYRPIRRADYELRYRKLKWTEGGIAGRVTERMFEADVAYKLVGVHESLRAEQPGARWELVAAILRRNEFGIVEQVERPDAQASLEIARIYAEERAKLAGGGWRPITQSVSQSHAVRRRADHRWVLQMVWADVAQSELEDPTVRQSGDPNRPSWYRGYIDSGRSLVKLGAGMRDNRRICIELLKEFDSRSSGQVEVQREAPSITPEQLAEVIELRKQGIPFAAIGRLLGRDPAELEQFALEAEAAPGGAETTAPKGRGKR